MQAIIQGLESETLGADEKAAIRNAPPSGFILFARNIRNRDQVRRLTDQLRDLVGRAELPILVDQEGGRVARLPPPEWPVFPAAARFDSLYRVAPISAIEAARANAEAMAVLLSQVGITMNCMPVLDLAHDGADPVIGDRSFGSDPMQVAALGRACLDGLAAGGVAGMIKHLPGHGRAGADSHHALPHVEAEPDDMEADLAPFAALRWAPAAMVAHILYAAWDADRPASLSPLVIDRIVRNRIGFGGLLVSDDIAMGALDPLSLDERVRGVIEAGCDLVLHGPGGARANEAAAQAAGPIGEAAVRRLDLASSGLAGRQSAESYERLVERRDHLLGLA